MKLFYKKILTAFLAISMLANPAIAAQAGVDYNNLQKSSTSKKSMVVTNNPWASMAANKILAQGGTATDAAISAALVLGLTEPQSSGIGGGGYAVTYHNNKLVAYDGREVAPHTADSKWFLDSNGKQLDFRTAWLSPRSVGVPGEIAMLYKMHQDNGKLAWSKLMQPAIDLAQNGFPLSPILYEDLVTEKDALIDNPQIKAVFFTDDNQIKPIGSIIKNPAYAKTLTQIAKDPMSFYTGQIASDIVHTVNTTAKQELYSLADLKNYKALTKTPLCSDYRGKYKICSAPPSTSGGVTTQEILKLFAAKYKSDDVDNSNWVYTFLEASKLAYADRNQYLADPKFVKQPVSGLLDNQYIAKRSQLIGKTALATPVTAGMPKGIDPQYAADTSPKPHGTTSLSIVDKYGNAVSMTVTVESEFGSHLFVDGFFLNNELTDFSFAAENEEGQPIANRVEAGKRPRSSIAPTIVLDKNKHLYAVAGSPGGSFIICTVARNLILMLDLKQNPYQAAAYPSFCAKNEAPIIENGDSELSKKIPELEAKGEQITRDKIFSGEANIMRVNNNWVGGSDPRREGVAIGG